MSDKQTTRLPKIGDEEKQLLQKWLCKEHKGHNQLNARWIKGGGAHGCGMVESKACKTTGAYEDLAKYVNTKLKSQPKEGDKDYWTPKIAATRFAAAFKAYGEACKLGSKSDSAIGATDEEVQKQVDYNQKLLALKIKKCPMFTTFDAVYSEHPTIHPVLSAGMGGDAVQGNIGEIGEGDSSSEEEQHDGKEAESVKGKEQGSKDQPSTAASQKKSTDNTDKDTVVKTEKKFMLKEGQKKQEFTAVWAAQMGKAKADKLAFEKREAKRRRLDTKEANKLAEKRAKADLMITLLGRNMNAAEIESMMRLAGFN